MKVDRDKLVVALQRLVESIRWNVENAETYDHEREIQTLADVIAGLTSKHVDANQRPVHGKMFDGDRINNDD